MNVRTPQPCKMLGSPIQLAILTLIASIHTAHAQEQSPAQAQVKATGESATIAEVFVTGTKRATSLQRTPVAITALNAAALEDAHVQTIQDVVNLVPGFSATAQGDHGVITMTMRGVGNDSAKTEYADPEVATFINGIYSPRPEGATALLFDLEGIEVLRGPQGTLWGRNATVGAVNMQTARPIIGETSGNIEGGMGNFNRLGVRGAFNVPVSDTMALRFAYINEKHDGYVDYQTLPSISIASQQAAYAASNKGSLLGFQTMNPNLFVANGPKYGAQDQSAARISMLWKPTAAINWNLSYEKYTDRGTPGMNLMQTPRDGQKLWSALIDTAPAVERNSDSLRSRVDFAINDGMAMAYIAGYSKFSGSSRYDQDGGAAVPTSFTTGGSHQENNTVSSNYVNYSHELELQSTGKRDVDWLLGLYYAAETNDIRFDIPIMNGTQQGSVGWQGSFIQPKETVESSAAFGQATWNATESLHFTGGLRYTKDTRTNVGGNGYTWNYDATVPQTPLNPHIDPTKPGQGYSPSKPSNDGTYTGDKVTGLARISYDLNKDNMMYASYSTGYKSGGLQDGGRTYGAETLTNYEIGSKHTLFGGTVKINNAFFYEDFKDFQFSAPVTNPDGSHTLATNNAEGAKIAGFETEIAVKLTKDDKIQVSLAYTPKATLGKLIGGSNDYALPKCVADPTISTCVDVTGFTMPHTPKIQAQFQYQHVFHMGDATITPRISVHYESESGLSVFSDHFGAPDKQEAYARTDLGLRYAAGRFYIDAFVRNVSDNAIKTSAQNGFSNGNGTQVWQSQYLAPRTFGFNAGMDF
ncbi:TonB-dependent receptor [Undibacterium sp. Ren11W]|uniref:TonB-dependent receptor n=1 Tax=Undibacterium sp. Ren11W TaxID=3413045 RepID=UPI003BF30CDF